MHQLFSSRYVTWVGLVLVVALGTLAPVIVRSFGVHRAELPDILLNYAILACSIGLGWVLCPTGLATRSVLQQVSTWLLGAAVLAVVILITHASASEAVLLYFAVPFLRVTYPSRSAEATRPVQWLLLALLVGASVLLTVLYLYLDAIFDLALRRIA